MRMRLMTKTMIVLGSLVVVVVVGVSIALFNTWHEKRVLDELISGNVTDMLAAAELDISLLRQRGYVASYIMNNGDRKWLEEIELLEPLFRARLERVAKSAETENERALFTKVGQTFDGYDAKRDEVVALFDRGEIVAARRVYLGELSGSYREVAALCDEIVELNKDGIEKVFIQSERAIGRMTAVMAVSLALTALLCIGIIWMLFRGIFMPIKRMTEDVRVFSARSEPSGLPYVDDDLETLSYYLRTLMAGLNEARLDLEKSRSERFQTERLAAIGTAVAHLAHEVRNPLTTIGGFAQSMEYRPNDVERVKEYSQIISQETSRLERMLSEVMQFSKPVSSQRRIQSLNKIVQNALSVHGSQLPEGISIDLDLDPAIPDVLVGEGPMEQIILNLLRNSIEAVGINGKITISTRPHEGGAILAVQDDGPGIPDDIRERVFEPFFTTKKKGHGLGLAICQQIINEHGGVIYIDSSPGKGTTFTVKIYPQHIYSQGEQQ